MSNTTDDFKFYNKCSNIANTLFKIKKEADAFAGVYEYWDKEGIRYYVSKIIKNYGTLLKYIKSTALGSEELGGKSLAILILYKQNKKDLIKKYAEIIKENRQADLEKLELEKQLREIAAARVRTEEICSIQEMLPNINLLHDTATIILNNGPWINICPTFNYDGKIAYTKNCPDDIYVVCDNLTLFLDRDCYGIYFCKLTTFEKRDGLVNILLHHSFYSGLTSINYGKPNNFRHHTVTDNYCTVIPYGIFMKNNKDIIAQFVEKNKSLLAKQYKQELIYNNN